MGNQIKYISYPKALNDQKEGLGIIIDVRQPPEFLDGHIPYAINLPSTKFQNEDYKVWQNQKIYLICQSGNRAKEIAKKLLQNGHPEVFVLDRHMEQISTISTSNRWTVDRQFRFLLGLLIGIYLIGYYSMSVFFSAIPIILCLGLIITAIIDKCYLRIGIAMMPWNEGQTE